MEVCSKQAITVQACRWASQVPTAVLAAQGAVIMVMIVVHQCDLENLLIHLSMPGVQGSVCHRRPRWWLSLVGHVRVYISIQEFFFFESPHEDIFLPSRIEITHPFAITISPSFLEIDVFAVFPDEALLTRRSPQIYLDAPFLFTITDRSALITPLKFALFNNSLVSCLIRLRRCSFDIPCPNAFASSYPA